MITNCFALSVALGFPNWVSRQWQFLVCYNEQLNKVANEEGYYNYLSVVQSSGYGKTRAIIQLATAQPLIYVCLHQVDLIGYPPMTPKSSEMLSDIEKAESIDNAKEIASQWLELMIWVFRDMHLEKRSHELLNDEVMWFNSLGRDYKTWSVTDFVLYLKTKANEFWNRVSTVKGNISISELQEQFASGTETGKIAIFLDESSHLLGMTWLLFMNMEQFSLLELFLECF